MVNAQLLYSSTICMLHYDPQHVSSSTLLILRRTNCVTTASGIVTLCKQPYSMQVESGRTPGPSKLMETSSDISLRATYIQRTQEVTCVIAR